MPSIGVSDGTGRKDRVRCPSISDPVFCSRNREPMVLEPSVILAEVVPFPVVLRFQWIFPLENTFSTTTPAIISEIPNHPAGSILCLWMMVARMETRTIPTPLQIA